MAQVSSSIAGRDAGHYGSTSSHAHQSSSGDTIQPNQSSYTPSSPAPFGSQIYPNSVVPYGSSSLLGANVLPVPFHSPPQNSAAPQDANRSPPVNHSQSPNANHNHSPRSLNTPTPGPSKRKMSDDASTGPRKRRQYVPIGSGLDGIERDEADLGPNGGPKHWTDSEKDTLFHWLMDSDKNWDMFRTKMNTVFRDAATEVFGSRKSFTALKSCYHRNVETFKQIFAFEAYLHRTPDQNAPINGPASLGNFNDPTMARQVYLEGKLDRARAASVPVANLNVKVIDHWHQKGWYQLFKRRYVDDGTGQAVPFYGPTNIPLQDGAPAPSYAHSSIDPQLTNGHGDDEDEEDEDEPNEQPSNASPVPEPPASSTSGSAGARPPLANPASILSPPLLHSQPDRDRRSQPLTSRRSVPSFAVNYKEAAAAEQAQAQTVQALDRLTGVTQALVDQCTSLTALLRMQTEARQGRGGGDGATIKEDGLNRKEKASLATDMLANPDVGEEVRRAAADYLKRLFMSE